MLISLILAHPEKTSFNHAIANTVHEELKKNGHEVSFHDLYAESFDPVLPPAEAASDASLPSCIEEHCREISRARAIIIVHPNWWGQPPAILKGWVDRVLRAGVAYEFLEGDSGEGIPVGLLKVDTAIVFNTSNTSVLRELQTFGDPLEKLWKDCIFGLCGVNVFYRRMFGVMVTSTEEQRLSWLQEVRDRVSFFFPA